jgi:hypothetical protein
MINHREWLVVVTKRVFDSGLCHRDIPLRLFQPTCVSKMGRPYLGQSVIFEDDGKVIWRVVYSHSLAKDGVKGVAYVTGFERHKDEWESDVIAEHKDQIEKQMPFGYQRKPFGRIVAGDMVWMPKFRAFREPCDLNFSSRVKDFAFVIELKEVAG